MERESLDVDILFVGGGVASLSSALHLASLVEKHRDKLGDDFSIAVLEKSSSPGLHCLSGAIMNPCALKELLPDYKELEAPLKQKVVHEDLIYLTKNRRFRLPFIPKEMDNRGHYLVSLAELTAWLGQVAEDRGVELFTGYAGCEILYDGDGVAGVRTGDQGMDKDDRPKSGFVPGIDIRARATVFGEGAHGNLTQALIRKFNLGLNASPQSYVLGIKEVWQLSDAALAQGYSAHLMGYPLKNDTYGGGFVYAMPDNMISLGLMVGLDYSDPGLDPYNLFQGLKAHPFVQKYLEKGTLLQYGARTVPVGGYFSVPCMAANRALIIGDGAGLFLNRQIKGIHAAMTSGMLAAKTLAKCLENNDFSSQRLYGYETDFHGSPVGRQMYQTRSFHQLFQQGRRKGMVKAALQGATRGRLFSSRPQVQPDCAHLKPKDSVVSQSRAECLLAEEALEGNKATDLYYSGTRHEEDQVCHIKILDPNICQTKCREEFDRPCLKFCPAGVYEETVDEKTNKSYVTINFTNCLHCKTCEIKDPYGNIIWTPPEGGGGPKYTHM